MVAGGYGNGPDDAAWAPAGYRLRDRSRQPETYRLRVGASAHGRLPGQRLVPVVPGAASANAGRAWPRPRDPAGAGNLPGEVTGEQSAKHCSRADE